MITKPMDVLEKYEIRKTKAQKAAFRTAVITYIQKLRYSVRVEKGNMGIHNIVVGDTKKAKYLVTAHYDTPASIGLPNLITPNNPVTYILMQLFLVGILLAVSVGAAFLVWLISKDDRLAFIGWYICHFGLLALMMMGPANRHNANDNTSGVVTVLEIISSLPENLRERVAFVLFDQEEKGLLGSSAYRKAHKEEVDHQIVLNLDCVGDGDVIQLTPVKKAKKNEAVLAKLECICGYSGKKQIQLRRKGFTAGSSDHKNFPYGVGIMTFRYKKGIGLYCSRIHTWRDTVLEQTNVNILRAAIISLIGSADK